MLVYASASPGAGSCGCWRARVSGSHRKGRFNAPTGQVGDDGKMYCRICSATLQENANFCFKCGARVRPQETTIVEEFQVSGRELVRKVEELIHEGNIRRIVIKHDGRILLDIPLAIAVVGVVLAPVLTAVGAVAAMVTNCTVSVERVEP